MTETLIEKTERELPPDVVSRIDGYLRDGDRSRNLLILMAGIAWHYGYTAGIDKALAVMAEAAKNR